ncbi:MAG: phosphatase family protein [Aeromicrobium sp.]|jgi:membrane-associated phospholipid phosphatase|nr:phosphatase family protein [Aeromicrobium sp.]
MVGQWRGILRQALIVIGAVVAYFGVRGLTEGSAEVAVRHAWVVVQWEKDLGLYVEKDMAKPFEASSVLATAANWVYIWGHWPAIAATMLWTCVRHRASFLRLRDAMIVSGALGMTIFVTYPVAPPRLAGLRFVDTVTERSSAYRVLQPPSFVNQYAAMPSLHAGWDLLVGIALVTAASSLLLRVVGLVMPALMAVAVVVTANHFVLDVIVGVGLALAGHLAALVLERRRRAVRPADDVRVRSRTG